VTRHGRTFKEILARQAQYSARRIEGKLREANWLAKIYPEQGGVLYSLKHQLLAHLYSIPGYAPKVFGVRARGSDVLLSVRLRATRSAVHAPASHLLSQLKIQGGVSSDIPDAGLLAVISSQVRATFPSGPPA
jgi:hypothetical protein